MADRICLFRFVQEALNNASRHAGGAGLTVALTGDAAGLRLTVGDRGPGVQGAAGLGLSGLRDRVESLGGRFAIAPRDGGGTEVAMVLESGAGVTGGRG
jgi:signal transduction histidine kinase